MSGRPWACRTQALEQRFLGYVLGPALPRPPETSLQWNPTTGRPPVPEQRELSEVICVQTARTHLLTGSHTRSCTTATRSPGRGRWPGNRRSAQEREENVPRPRATPSGSLCSLALCLFPAPTVARRELGDPTTSSLHRC